MDDYHIKAQLIGELRDAVMIKDMNMKLSQSLTEILEALGDYKTRPNTSNEKRVDELLEKGFSIICELGKQSPEFQQWLVSTRRFNKSKLTVSHSSSQKFHTSELNLLCLKTLSESSKLTRNN
jgi:hypothetical protein